MAVTEVEAQRFLSERFGPTVEAVEALPSGEGSQAFGFRRSTWRDEPGGLARGVWEVEVTIDVQAVQRGRFTVE